VIVTTPDDQFERRLPTEAMAAVSAYAQTHPGSLILTDELASALVWHEPALAGRIGFDTRLEQYDSKSLENWFEFLSVVPPGWPTLTDCYGQVLVSSDRLNLMSALSTLTGWSTLASEPSGAAFVRDGANTVTADMSGAAPPDPGSDLQAGNASRCAQPRDSVGP